MHAHPGRHAGLLACRAACCAAAAHCAQGCLLKVMTLHVCEQQSCADGEQSGLGISVALLLFAAGAAGHACMQSTAGDRQPSSG